MHAFNMQRAVKRNSKFEMRHDLFPRTAVAGQREVCVFELVQWFQYLSWSLLLGLSMQVL